jgi:CheY-like chemotaxis protein
MSNRYEPTPRPAADRTALLVEDDLATMRFYLAGLKGLGEFTLLAARNGAEALTVLQSKPVDVVVTDLRMPVLDGYGLIAVLAEKYPSLPVIVLTSVAEPGLLDRVAALGVLRVLPKPAHLSRLMEEIRAAAAVQPQGIVQGLGLSSLVQLLNWERKTATLTIRSEAEVGFLYVRDGELVHAACGREEGLAAALRILGWEGAHVEFVGTCRVQPSLDLPVAELLMKAAMARDAGQHRAPEPGKPATPETWYD